MATGEAKLDSSMSDTELVHDDENDTMNLPDMEQDTMDLNINDQHTEENDASQLDNATNNNSHHHNNSNSSNNEGEENEEDELLDITDLNDVMRDLMEHYDNEDDMNALREMLDEAKHTRTIIQQAQRDPKQTIRGTSNQTTTTPHNSPRCAKAQ